MTKLAGAASGQCDAAQRMRWSNLPTTMVARAGLKMGDLSAAQKAAAMSLLAATLSRRGYEKVLAIMEGDEQLKIESGGRGGINLDGRISPEEEQAYAGEVGRDVELQVDGKPVPLRLIASQFPSLQAMQDGLGTIRLNMRADHSGHELRFENRHMPRVSVYLVNCLASRDNGLLVGRPERDEAQRSIRFAYSFAETPGIRPDPGWPEQGAFWLAVTGMLALGRLALRRGRPPNSIYFPLAGAGNANAITASDVGSRRNPPPAAETTTYCLPSRPM